MKPRDKTYVCMRTADLSRKNVTFEKEKKTRFKTIKYVNKKNVFGFFYKKTCFFPNTVV